MRLALAQINLTVGDIQGNAALIRRSLERAQGYAADLVLFPELTLTGYPPEDLLLKPIFVRANRRALDRTGRAVRHAPAVVGFVDSDSKGRLYDAAAVLDGGKAKAVYRKQCLPNYAVFDERRYFYPGTKSVVFRAGGYRFGLLICEDLWEDAPLAALARKGVDAVLVLSASPYHAGKLQKRKRLFCEKAKKHRVTIAYCNLVGGQDELIFDGGSLVCDAKGRVRAEGRQFEEDLVLYDMDPPRGARGRAGVTAQDADKPAIPPFKQIRRSLDAELYEALVLGVRDYTRKNGFRRVVLGISGGIDSALTACIAADALGAENVIGISMPSRYSSRETRSDAARLAQVLGVRHSEAVIEPIYEAYLRTVESLETPLSGGEKPEGSGITEQNIQARIRGNLLMALSNRFGWLVLTTGNKSETATGYTTLYGDMAGGFAVIKDVPKTRVYSLARYRNALGPGEGIPQSILDRAPTAELAENQKDQDSLPPYPVLDRILEAYVERDLGLVGVARGAKVERVLAKQVIRMVDRAEYKRRQGPPGIRITPKAFGKDRRMPITNKWTE